MATVDPPPRLHMDAILTPQRSLSRKGFAILLAGLGAYNLLIVVFLLTIGAYPVPIFLGLDFLAVIIALKVNYAGAATAERVQVSADHVRVTHRNGGRERTVWTSPTAFTAVQVEKTARQDTCVRLKLSGRTLSIGAALGPKARADLAEQLDRAIRSARAERYG